MRESHAEDYTRFGGSFLCALTNTILHVGVAQLQDSYAIDDDLAIPAVAPLVRNFDHRRSCTVDGQKSTFHHIAEIDKEVVNNMTSSLIPSVKTFDSFLVGGCRVFAGDFAGLIKAVRFDSPRLGADKDLDDEGFLVAR